MATATERWDQLIEAINVEPPRDEVYKEDVQASADLYKRAMQALNAELVAALEAVQWIPLGNRKVCPNCGRRWDQGHAPTCKVAAALAKAKELSEK